MDICVVFTFWLFVDNTGVNIVCRYLSESLFSDFRCVNLRLGLLGQKVTVYLNC